jgi:hypothetical protein
MIVGVPTLGQRFYSLSLNPGLIFHELEWMSMYVNSNNMYIGLFIFDKLNVSLSCDF